MQDATGKWLVCCIKGCDGKPDYSGLCVNHYRLNKKYGSPVAYKNVHWHWRGLSLEQRFWASVRKGDGCWNWQSSKDQDGYGIFKAEHDGVMYHRAHRYSFALHHGPITEGLYCCHSCDNPSCVRPDHLFAGTPLANQRDKIAKGRSNTAFGERRPEAILTEAQAKDILQDPRPHSVIASQYGVHVQTISSLKTRVSWKHLGPEKGVKAKRISPRRGKSDKVTPEIVREIRTSTDRGVDLAARYGLKPQDITDIRKRRSWAHIE
jgi:hypothetical protein